MRRQGVRRIPGISPRLRSLRLAPKARWKRAAALVERGRLANASGGRHDAGRWGQGVNLRARVKHWRFGGGMPEGEEPGETISL